MSFSGTPLGQGRRLDHHRFLGKPPSNGNLPPPSYAYGAPALGSRSPPKPTSPSRPRNGAQVPENGQEDDSETTLQRFAKLKQQDSAGDLTFRPAGPKAQTSSSLNPAKLPRDTTVNVANAFFQAANGPDMSATHNNPHNNSWASSSREKAHLPRSTSVEYEANASAQTHKRLAAPPDKLGRTPRKPPSKSTSSLHVPDSEAEGDSRGLNGRAKSPFESSLTFAKNALGAAAFYVRHRSREPEEHSIEQPPANGATNGNGNDSSYDYAEEEQAYQTQKRNNATHKRNRMSVDNKAYKPSQSDEDESEYSDDGKTRRRRRKAKKGPAGGPLTSLPVVGSDKRRRRKGHGSKGNLGGPDEDESDSEENTQMDIQSQSAQLQASGARTSNPPLSRASVPRFSVEPPEYDPDDSMISANQGLDSIPEIDENLLPAEPEPPVRQSSQQRRGRSRTPAPQPPASSFSVGGILGSIVHVIIKLSLWLFSGSLSVLSVSTFLFGQVFGTTFDLMLRRPAGWARSASHMLKYLMPALVLLVAWYTLQSASLGSYIPTLSYPSQTPVYQAPAVPPANIADLSDRLLRLENVISGLAADNERTKTKTEDAVRVYSDVLGRVGSVEGRLYDETKRNKEAEAKARETISRTIGSVKQEVEVLHSQIVAQQKQHEKDQRTPAEIADEEARAKLRALEERVGGVEGGVKEALELGKKAATAVPPPATGWPWSKSSSGSKPVLQIKSADGQDVSELISHMVDSAVSLSTKDGGVAKPDYALYSGGGRVVPQLTSELFEIVPRGFGNQLMSLFSGNPGYTAFPPVTALHPDLQPGRCWPFAGDNGRLGVALAAPVYVEEVTIDHIAMEVAYDMSSAPREMEVWGMLEGQDNLERVAAWKAERAAKRQEAGLPEEADEDIAYPTDLPKRPEFLRLAKFTYDIHASNNVQTFPVDPEIKDLGVDFGIVVLRVLSNWGQSRYTCVYRFRVHGQRMGGIPGPLFGDGMDEESSSSAS